MCPCRLTQETGDQGIGLSGALTQRFPAMRLSTDGHRCQSAPAGRHIARYSETQLAASFLPASAARTVAAI